MRIRMFQRGNYRTGALYKEIAQFDHAVAPREDEVVCWEDREWRVRLVIHHPAEQVIHVQVDAE